MIAFGLVSVGYREIADGIIELVARSEITTDPRGVSSLGVSPCDHPSARLGVTQKHLTIKGFHSGLDLGVAELPHIELLVRGLGRAPAEKNVRGRLHQALPHDHTLAMVGVSALSRTGFQHGGDCFFELQKQWIVAG
jgi:hypothetical protein